jgi:hypothetical protein
MNAIIIPQIIETNILLRIRNPLLLDGFYDAVSSPADRSVLEFHDGARTERIVGVEIACECGDRRHADYYFVDFVVFPGSHDTFYDCGADFVPYGVLRVGSGSYEELVFDVDEVLAVVNYFDVGVCYGMLKGLLVMFLSGMDGYLLPLNFRCSSACSCGLIARTSHLDAGQPPDQSL